MYASIVVCAFREKAVGSSGLTWLSSGVCVGMRASSTTRPTRPMCFAGTPRLWSLFMRSRRSSMRPTWRLGSPTAVPGTAELELFGKLLDRLGGGLLPSRLQQVLPEAGAALKRVRDTSNGPDFAEAETAAEARRAPGHGACREAGSGGDICASPNPQPTNVQKSSAAGWECHKPAGSDVLAEEIWRLRGRRLLEHGADHPRHPALQVL